MKILIVEDEPELLSAMQRSLEGLGLICSTASSYRDGESKLAGYDYDVVVLDITLPGGSGIDLLKQLKRSVPDRGVLIVSAKGSIDDKLLGLDLGADDYITKPFHMAELNARVQAVLRRRSFGGRSVVELEDIAIDTQARTVHVLGKALTLTRKEYDLLLFMVVNKGRLLTRDAMAEHIWGDHMDLADNTDVLYSHIKNLRGKIRAAGGTDRLRTVYGLGYMYTTDNTGNAKADPA
jgi:DNA-binding response OmpR family regulator